MDKAKPYKKYKRVMYIVLYSIGLLWAIYMLIVCGIPYGDIFGKSYSRYQLFEAAYNVVIHIDSLPPQDRGIGIKATASAFAMLGFVCCLIIIVVAATLGIVRTVIEKKDRTAFAEKVGYVFNVFLFVQAAFYILMAATTILSIQWYSDIINILCLWTPLFFMPITGIVFFFVDLRKKKLVIKNYHN